MSGKRFRKLMQALMTRVMESQPDSRHKGAGIRWATNYKPSVPYQDAWSSVKGLAAEYGIGRG